MLRGACGTFHSARSHAPGTANGPPFSSFATELAGAPSRIITRRSTVSYKALILLLSILAFGSLASADEWNKSYQVGNNPTLHVETNDASIEVNRGVSNTIAVHIVADGYTIGNSGVRVTEHQDGDKVDLNVHIPNQWGIRFGMHQGVRVQVQVPPQASLDMHSGDGHPMVN